VQVPFLEQPFYAGPLVGSLSGTDIFWIVGFGVATLLRFVRARQGLPGADPVAS
jgi:hypothetical protein